MAISVQVTFDARDPHAQARFWAAALGYQKEDHTTIVDSLAATDDLPSEHIVDVDGGRGFADVAAVADPEGRGPRLFFQRVPEAKTAKNRVHLDLHVGPRSVQAEADRLIDLGASYLWTSTDRGTTCITLADPEGNEFCVD